VSTCRFLFIFIFLFLAEIAGPLTALAAHSAKYEAEPESRKYKAVLDTVNSWKYIGSPLLSISFASVLPFASIEEMVDIANHSGVPTLARKHCPWWQLMTDIVLIAAMLIAENTKDPPGPDLAIIEMEDCN
jgi:hypothetical protein